jgi:anti-sigma B factor antagonist
MLTINRTGDGELLTVALGGRLDAAGAAQLEAELSRALKNTKTLVFDLQDLRYISTGGLRVLLSAQKRMNRQGRMRLTNVGETVMRTIEVKGFEEIFHFTD